MKNPNKLLINLDLTDLDIHLLLYAAYLCDVLPIKNVVVIHNILIQEPPEELKALYPDLEEPVDELVKREIDEKINEHLSKSDVEIYLHIFQNKTVSEIVKWVNRQDIDISIVGKKSEPEKQGIYARQFLRLTTHPVMLIPENTSLKVRRLVAAVDFSKNAINIIQTAHALARHMDADIKYLHAYSLPPRYFPYLPRDMDKYREEYLRYARKEFESLKKKSLKEEASGTCYFKKVDIDNIAKEIYQWAKEERADLIVTGAKGKTDAEVLLLGSVTEELTTMDNNIPLLVVKRKEHYGWLESLWA